MLFRLEEIVTEVENDVFAALDPSERRLLHALLTRVLEAAGGDETGGAVATGGGPLVS